MLPRVFGRAMSSWISDGVGAVTKAGTKLATSIDWTFDTVGVSAGFRTALADAFGDDDDLDDETLEKEFDNMDLNHDGKLEFDEVHLVHETGTPASHSAVLRVEEALQDTKKGDDEAKWKLLTKALREPETSCLGADQAKKLIETFDSPQRREEVLKMILPKIVAIDLYEAMRGCV